MALTSATVEASEKCSKLNLLCIFQNPVDEFKVFFPLVVALGVEVHDLGDLVRVGCIANH